MNFADSQLRSLYLNVCEVCEKNSLRYFMDSGTLLGTARHQGFIPWDNDIDVSMPYDDYVRLRDIAKSEFYGPYLFQSEYDSARAGRGELISRLRNRETTAIDRRAFDMRFSHSQGIWIDIFLLIGIPPASERKQFICEIHELLRQQGIIVRKRISDISVDIEAELSAQFAQFEKLETKYSIIYFSVPWDLSAEIALSFCDPVAVRLLAK